MKVKADLETMVKDRNEALFSYDERKIRAYMRKYGLRAPTNNTVFWGGGQQGDLQHHDGAARAGRKSGEMAGGARNVKVIKSERRT